MLQVLLSPYAADDIAKLPTSPLSPASPAAGAAAAAAAGALSPIAGGPPGSGTVSAAVAAVQSSAGDPPILYVVVLFWCLPLLPLAFVIRLALSVDSVPDFLSFCIYYLSVCLCVCRRNEYSWRNDNDAADESWIVVEKADAPELLLLEEDVVSLFEQFPFRRVLTELLTVKVRFKEGVISVFAD